MSDPYISEVKYLGSANHDFIEVVVDAGTDVSNIAVTIYRANGTVRSTNALETHAATIAGKDVYLITTVESSTFNGLHKQGGVSLSDDNGVHQFISFDDGAPITATEGAANGLTSEQIGQTGEEMSLETLDGGATYHLQQAPNDGIIPCFVTGTRIATPMGEVPVENLRPDDLVQTPCGHLRRVCAVLTRRVSRDQALRTPTLRPICFRAGSLAPDLPRRDLYLSRQHRVLVRSAIARRMFATPQVLVAAHQFLAVPGVAPVPVADCVTYHHLLLDRHAVVLAEGAPCESFLIAPISMRAVTDAARARVISAFPQASDPDHSEHPAATIPPGHRQARLVHRHLSNRKAFVEGRAISLHSVTA